MAITTNAICNSFKKELLQGSHDFDASTDTYKLAMYTSSATLGKSTENYSTNPGGGSNTEVTSANYTAGGGALIYNTTTNGGSNTTDAVCVLDFGSDKTATSGTFTIQFPAFTTSAAILRIA